MNRGAVSARQRQTSGEFISVSQMICQCISAVSGKLPFIWLISILSRIFCSFIMIMNMENGYEQPDKPADGYGYDERHDDVHVPHVCMLKKPEIAAWIVRRRDIFRFI